MKNGRKHRDIKLVPQKGRNYLVLETNLKSNKWFFEYLLRTGMEKNKIMISLFGT